MFFTLIYRRVIPQKLRKQIYKAVLEKYFQSFDTVKYKMYFAFHAVFPPKTEKSKCRYFMGKHQIVNYPYPYYLEYMAKDVEYHFDSSKNLPYVIHNNKRLYFKNIPQQEVERNYRLLAMEQDVRSAHCYVENYDMLRGKVILDVGAAEGIFALNAIDYAEHLFLFECEKDWIAPLEATFESMKDKITIVEKYVSDVNEDNIITLDEFAKNKQLGKLFLKMDIEGYECKALSGCKDLFLKTPELSGAICTYHKHDDAKNIATFLAARNYKSTPTNGYIYNERSLRTGILRFE